MAEPFGIAAGAVGIATTFTACVDCFGYYNSGVTSDETFRQMC